MSLTPQEIDLAIFRQELERRTSIRRFDWNERARDDQKVPPGDWRIWLVLAGRGWGKTRVGAETVRIWSESFPRISLIGRTIQDVRDLMIEGISGLEKVFPGWRRIEWVPSRRLIRFPSGAIGKVFTSDEPEMLRGPEHMKIWADEVAAWVHPRETWDMAMLGLRQGSSPQVIATTTPKPITLIRDLLTRSSLAEDPKGKVILTVGSTYANRDNLAPEFLAEILGAYEGTRLGRQELHAEVLTDVENALLRSDDIPIQVPPLAMIEGVLRPDMSRVVVAIDPAVTSEADSDETGIIGAGICRTPDHLGRSRGWILEDRSLRGTPHEWATAAVRLYHELRADRIVAEANNGGEMVETTIHTVDPNVPVLLVHASKGKQARAEPVAALYQQGRIIHARSFPELESQWTGWEPTGGGRSPDRLDAATWAITNLLIGDPWGAYRRD